MITVAAQDLHRILHNVVPFTLTDSYSPILRGVLLEKDKGSATLSAVATDSYRLGSDAAPIIICSDDSFAAVIDRSDVKLLLSVLHRYRPLKKRTDNPAIDVSLINGSVRFTLPTMALEFRPVEGTFPVWRKVFPTDKPPADASLGAFTSVLLSSFSHLISSDRTPVSGKVSPILRLTSYGYLKPCKVESGTFTGLMMPTRIQNSAPQ